MNDSYLWVAVIAMGMALVIVLRNLPRILGDRRWPFYLALWLGIAVALALGYRLLGAP